ncbi:uncharacterized protein LOC143913558 [Arctopsyche grandis]|uniref:uncharacterized protein LOC143913558 n=1 Tax=Arctopsyche grandis TaxID=121162 RepID=UPI00406D9327
MNRLDTQKIIGLVRQKRNLWDHFHEDYKNTEVRKQTWLDIAEQLVDDYHDKDTNEQRKILKGIQQRWKSARDAYVKTRKTESTFVYIYSKLMGFLDGTTDCTNLDSMDQLQSSLSKESNNSDEDHAEDCKPAKNQQIKKRRHDDSEFEKRVLDFVNKPSSSTSPEDADMSFFVSLLPIVQEYTNAQKLMFRSRVLDVALEIEDMNNII